MKNLIVRPKNANNINNPKVNPNPKIQKQDQKSEHLSGLGPGPSWGPYGPIGPLWAHMGPIL